MGRIHSLVYSQSLNTGWKPVPLNVSIEPGRGTSGREVTKNRSIRALELGNILLPMPILPKEPDIFPDDLLADDRKLDTEGAWWALYTLSRREKELIRRLRTHQICHYCPLIRRKTRSPSGRVRDSFVPLFAGYVFMFGAEEQRYQALTTNCISRTLEISDPSCLLRDLRQIQRLVDSEAPLTPEARIAPGTRVRVRSGPFLGLEGTVLQRRGKQRLMVAIEFLQQGASVLIEDCELDNIDR